MHLMLVSEAALLNPSKQMPLNPKAFKWNLKINNQNPCEIPQVHKIIN